MAPLSLDPKVFGASGVPKAWPRRLGRIQFDNQVPFADRPLPLNFDISAAAGHASWHASELQPEIILTSPLFPRQDLTPLSVPELEQKGESGQPAELDARKGTVSWKRMKQVWRNAPGDLKLLTTLLPVLMAFALIRSVPKVSAHTGPPNSKPVLAQIFDKRWKTFRENIMKRAGVEYVDDFRSGLDEWQSRANLTAHWSYDAAGFVRPGPLALYRPTLDLTDYSFEFLGEIDQKGLGFVYRAADLDNYYVVKLAVAKPGPLPVMQLVRYAVIHGKEGAKQSKPLPLTARTDMLYRIRLVAHGSDFALFAQDQVVDAWSDGALKKGGVGFFCGKGEQARIRWVEVSHQYDKLGRLCAYLTPGGPG